MPRKGKLSDHSEGAYRQPPRKKLPVRRSTANKSSPSSAPTRVSTPKSMSALETAMPFDNHEQSLTMLDEQPSGSSATHHTEQPSESPATHTSEQPRRSLRRRPTANYTSLYPSDDEMLDHITRHPSEESASVTYSSQSSEDAPELSDSSSEDSNSNATDLSSESERKSKRQKTSKSTSKLQVPTAAEHLHSVVSNQVDTDDGEVELFVREKNFKTRKLMTSLLKGSTKEVRQDLPPLSSISEIFLDITKKANKGFGTAGKMEDVVNHLRGRPLRVATMCSGTESPMLALQMISDCQKTLGLPSLKVEHVFSAEIVAWKQAYIERNFRPPILFRDISEITTTQDGKATTAYGARVVIPDKVDLLVAGTACVDFSNLNNKKKSLDDVGESSDTFIAVFNYANKYRPAIVVLENILGAPWDIMIGRFQAIGYVATGVTVDTKEFYLPQTRQRGYIVCVDVCKLENLGSANDEQSTKEYLNAKPAQGVRNRFVEMMEKLRRPVSSPVSSFLLPDDDPDVIRSRHSRARQSELDKPMRTAVWAKCELRHIVTRQIEGLGNARPLTDWQESGILVLPEHCDKQWFKTQVERVWDFIDISVLRNAGLKPKSTKKDLQPYDSQFKSRVWNVSQNIDRTTDHAAFGLVDCLTPTGSFWLSHRGGPLVHTESLALQGLPLGTISFTTESERMIQDLAGNAMSTTVVGSAIISALISGYKALEPGSECVPEDVATTHSGIADAHELSEQELGVRVNPSDIDLDSLLEDAILSTMKCHCEGRAFISERPIQICKDCGHTACMTCAGKPSHNYENPEYCQRSIPEGFIRTWRSKMPMIVQFQSTENLGKLLRSLIKQANEYQKQYVEAVLQAVVTPLTFKEFRRMSHWIVCYDSPVARLELMLDPECLQWKLFVKPASWLPGKHHLRASFQQPVAKALAVNGSFFGEIWEWRAPTKISSNAGIEAHGQQVPSWFARLGLVETENDEMPSDLKVKTSDAKLDSSVSGSYTYLPNCGTACESLYKRVGPGGLPDVYLFLESPLIQEPKYDTFVFARDHSRLPHDQTREIIASVHSSWRPWTKSAKTTSVKVEYDSWHTEASCTLIDASTPPILAIRRQPLMGESCSAANAAISLDFQLPYADVEGRFIGKNTIKPDDTAFFSTFNWAMQPLYQDLELDGKHDMPGHVSSECNDCAPQFPQFRWNLQPLIPYDARTGKYKDATLAVRPYEDPKTAANYETSLKKRSEAFVIESEITTEDGASNAKLCIGINALALCHRAAGKLRRLTHLSSSVSWSLDTKWLELSSSRAVPGFLLRNNNGDIPATAPTKQKLFKKQQQSLSWMKQQEQGKGPAFALEEIDEALLPHLGWRLEAKASATINSKGGILADHAGFGKTATSLTLISLDEHSVPEPGKVEDQSKPHKINATLIICPHALVSQWKGEVVKFLGDKFANLTLTIKTMADLDRQTVKNFEDARIIIVSNQIWQTSNNEQEYLKHLAAFTGLPECSSKGPRELKAWLKLAAAAVPKSFELRDQMPSKFNAHLQELFKKNIEDDAMKAFAKASKRLRGEKFVEVKMAAQAKALRKDIAAINKSESTENLIAVPQRSQADVKNLQKRVFFEMFTFHRLIIDEFSYLSNKELVWYSTINSDRRWGLSATPQLKDPFDVSRMACLLGINLPIGASAPGLISDKNMSSLRDGMTNLEIFETFRDAPSRAIQQQVHGLSQKFLDTFVRQNVLEFEESPYFDCIVPIRLHADHRLTYTELSQKLNSQDMRVQSATPKGRPGKDQKVSAEELLVKKAAFFDPAVRTIKQTASNHTEKKTARKGGKSNRKKPKKTAVQGGEADSSVEDDDDALGADDGPSPGDEDVLIEQSDSSVGVGLAALIKQRTQALHNVEQVLLQNLNKARKCAQKLREEERLPANNCPYHTWANSTVCSNALKDESMTNDLEQMIGLGSLTGHAKLSGTEEPKRGIKRSHDEIDTKRLAAIQSTDEYNSLRDLVSKIKTQAREWAAIKKALRYVLAASGYMNHQDKETTPACSGTDCTAVGYTANGISLSAVCGHMVCDGCFEHTSNNLSECPAPGCSVLVKAHNLLRLSKLGEDSNSTCGKKVDDVCSLLSNIARKNEQAILFVQYDDQMDQVAAALDERGISCTWSDSGPDFITNWQGGRKPQDRTTVLILNSSDVSAAGTNLVRANHVIFYAPLLVNTQYQYDAQMAQAIGRVRRHGQQREIFVYRLTALDTIDVDILEQRELRPFMLSQHPDTIPRANKAVSSKKDLSRLNVLNDHKKFECTKLLENAKKLEQASQLTESQSIRDQLEHMIKPEKTQLIRDATDNTIKLVPKTMLLEAGGNGVVEGKNRVRGYEDFSSLVKFSRAFSDDA